MYSLNSIFTGIGVKTSDTKLIKINTTIDPLNVWQDCLINRQKLTSDDVTSYEYFQIQSSVPEDVLSISHDDDDYILNGIDESKISIRKFCKYSLLVIPERITKISDEAFKGVISDDDYDTHMSLSFGGNKITEIGKSAFENCTGLVGTISMTEEIKKLGDRAFYNTGLESVAMSSALTNIGTEAFANNRNLISASIACEVDPEKLES
ncbi:MAG: leucine-rich repeat domain-containing protein [Mycoplasmoidaceae bacterium]|nr:leucine-rich repeat domain-containing protein [Mycoplasmoidaceae bacterium]